jgi:hypothetical protein
MDIAHERNTPERHADEFVKWIPIMVPFFAVVLCVAVLLIDLALG